MAHIFDPKNLTKLDNPNRRKILPPNETLLTLGLSPNDILIDIGAGIGYFTIPALHIIAPDNPIYALDTSPVMLLALKERELELTGAQRITTVLTETYDFKLPPSTATFVLLVNVLHEVDIPHKFIENIAHLTRLGGKIAVIDWVKKQSPTGPPYEHRLSEDTVLSLLTANGYTLCAKREFGDDFYSIVAELSL